MFVCCWHLLYISWVFDRRRYISFFWVGRGIDWLIDWLLDLSEHRNLWVVVTLCALQKESFIRFWTLIWPMIYFALLVSWSTSHCWFQELCSREIEKLEHFFWGFKRKFKPASRRGGGGWTQERGIQRSPASRRSPQIPSQVETVYNGLGGPKHS